uniref:Uncharacterized protein n=1 Tax=Dulem virus 40 TaxID=3145758 RepID=A0AAU8AXS4_9CAUD
MEIVVLLERNQQQISNKSKLTSFNNGYTLAQC